MALFDCCLLDFRVFLEREGFNYEPIGIISVQNSKLNRCFSPYFYAYSFSWTSNIKGMAADIDVPNEEERKVEGIRIY